MRPALASSLIVLWTCVSLATPAPALTPKQDIPAAAQGGQALFDPIRSLIGQTWRGTGAGPNRATDIMRWDWAVGGHAVQVTHAVNGGVYGGLTLIFPDKDTGRLIFHYFTTGGFHTTGFIQPGPDGAIDIDETVHGLEGIEHQRSRGRFGPDGSYHTRGLRQEGDQWVEFGGFDYVPDPSAQVVLTVPDPNAGATPVPATATAAEAPASVGALDLSRRIVANPGEAGHDVAGYLRIQNGDPVADRLVGASCTCADRIEFHAIRRVDGRVSMDTLAALNVSGRGTLDIRPGSDLHLMLVNFDPARAVDGRVRMHLEFAESGSVEADFILAADSRAAWAQFDPPAGT